MSDAGALRAGLCDLDIEPGERALEKLLAYLELVRRWSRAYNLVSPGDLEQFIPRHLLDCAAVAPFVPGGTLIDAGSGAGLPGVPLAILRPELRCTLLDSVGKKVRFLRHVQRTLGLDNVTPVHHRLEQWAPEPPPDTIISRAFKSLLDFGTAVRHLVAPETRLLAMKGRYPEAEITALPEWLKVLEVKKIDVPQLQAERHLVIMAGSVG
ncbi:MAG: 16S rRNA (guanine(527)-N(7))-methyltransferase RsmG [Xanthomonadales bacterium]|nr:16S rRNA (guanine(527)-N(7))-methyltransferase RsmG [Xanthomonadales bacterium]